MAVQNVGGATGTSGGSTAGPTSAFTSVSGSLIVVLAAYWNTAGASAGGDVTDSKSNTYSVWTDSLGGVSAAGIAVYYNNAGTRGSSHTISVNRINDAGSWATFGFIEITGQSGSPINTDTDATATDGTSPFDVTAAASIPSGSTVLYAASIDTGTDQAIGDPSGYSVIYEEPNGSFAMCLGSHYKENESGTPTVGCTKAGSIAAAREVIVSVNMSSTPTKRPWITRRSGLAIPIPQTIFSR